MIRTSRRATTTMGARDGLRHAQFKPMKRAMDGAFGDREHGAAANVEGTTRAHASDGSSFVMTQPSGLARSQQVFLAQKFLNLPAMPSYVESEGGMVLDRVVLNAGRGNWWTTLTARARAQRAWNTEQVQEGKAHRALLDPAMYALGGRFRANALQNVAVKAIGELGSVKGVTRAFAKKFKLSDEKDDDAEAALNPRGRVSVQAKLPSHLLSVDLSHNERYQTDDRYVDGPTSASVSVSSRGRRAINYRVSARKWLGDLVPFDRKHGGGMRTPPRKELQAGVSYEQQAVLWRGRRRRKPKSSSAVSGYTALPQVPTITVGGIYGAVVRKSLDDDYKDGEQTELQNFGSLSVNAQVGSFARPLLDFTSINLRLDAGGMGTPNKPLDAAAQTPLPLADRLITMGGRLKANPVSVTLSLGQQLLGPLRFRAEVRASGAEALSATRAGLSALKERKTMTEVRESIQKQIVKPEVVYGLDCALPPTIGSARVVAWYNATRQEAMAELRLFDL